MDSPRLGTVSRMRLSARRLATWAAALAVMIAVFPVKAIAAEIASWSDCPNPSLSVFLTDLQSNGADLSMLVGLENVGPCAAFVIHRFEFVRWEMWTGPVLAIEVTGQHGGEIEATVRKSAIGHLTRLKSGVADMEPIAPAQGITVRVSICEVWQVAFPTPGSYRVRARLQIPEPEWEPSLVDAPPSKFDWASSIASGVFESQPIEISVDAAMIEECAK